MLTQSACLGPFCQMYAQPDLQRSTGSLCYVSLCSSTWTVKCWRITSSSLNWSVGRSSALILMMFSSVSLGGLCSLRSLLFTFPHGLFQPVPTVKFMSQLLKALSCWAPTTPQPLPKQDTLNSADREDVFYLSPYSTNQSCKKKSLISSPQTVVTVFSLSLSDRQRMVIFGKVDSSFTHSTVDAALRITPISDARFRFVLSERAVKCFCINGSAVVSNFKSDHVLLSVLWERTSDTSPVAIWH